MAKGSRQYGNYDSRANRIAGGILIIIISLIATLSLLNIMGGVGRMISGFLIGVFGYVAYAYAFSGIFIGAMVTLGKRVTLPANKAIKYSILFALGVTILHIWFSRDYFLLAKNDAGKYVFGQYLGALYRGESISGLIGGIFAWIMMRIFTPAYSLVVMIILFALASIFSFYPMLINRSNYRTKSTKIRLSKNSDHDYESISNDDIMVKTSDKQVGNKMFVGTLSEDAPQKKQKQKKHNDFSLLFPNQDNKNVVENNVTENEVVDERRLAREKLFGKRDNTITNDSGVVFGASVNEEDVTPSLKTPGEKLFNRDNKSSDDEIDHRPQKLKDAFDLPETDEDKAKDFQERFGYILDTPTTSNDVFGAASKNLAEPRRVKEPEQEPVVQNNKEEKGNDMPYFIREILYGKQEKAEEKDENPSNKFEEVVEPSYKPLEKPKSIDKEELAPIEETVVEEKTTESTGSIFTLFGAALPDKKDSGIVKPISKAIDKPVVQKEEKQEPSQNVYVRDATPSEKSKKEDTVLPSLNGDGYSSGYEPINTPKEKPMTRFEEMQAESNYNSDAVMPTDEEIKNVLNPEKPVREKVEKVPPEKMPERTVEKKQDTMYTNNSNVGKCLKEITPEKKKATEQISIDQAIMTEHLKKPYMAPPTTLLRKIDDSIVQEDYTERSQKLEQALSNFKIDAKVVGVTQGPTFSRFEMQMPVGVPVSSVTKYADDIAMNLELASGVRFETPIPGKNAFGVEVANNVKTPVGLRSIIEGEKFKTSKSVLTFALGKDISNDDIVCDLESMPHLLIAGGTGSGKSVCINSLILSLLYRNGPNDLKLILIDPKMVEMTPYNGLPHLLVPEAIKDVPVAVNALDWAIAEMNRRYKMFVGIARNIDDYNKYAATHEGVNKLPRIVIVFDELADFMNKARHPIEDQIASLTSLSRAAGIHLIISTQRPSVEIITGTIKSNLPSRIALSLKTAADSMTILGCGGAEKLLGYGDMLYFPQTIRDPHRLQGCYVDTEEVFAVVNYIKEHNESYYDPEIKNTIFRNPEEEKEREEKEIPVRDQYSKASVGKNGETQQFIDALWYGVSMKKISVSKLQRKFGIGYNSAAKIVELMEELDYVSEAKGGNAPREVLLSEAQFRELYGDPDRSCDATEADIGDED